MGVVRVFVFFFSWYVITHIMSSGLLVIAVVVVKGITIVIIVGIFFSSHFVICPFFYCVLVVLRGCGSSVCSLFLLVL